MAEENTSIMTSNVDQAELQKFSELAHRWWDPESEFRPLHEINPLRLDYIDGIAAIAGKTVLDVGCGGGILSESMAALGARVTGIDLGDAPLPRFDLLDVERYNRLTVQTQRGCPWRCEFCAASIRLTNRYKVKPVKKILAEVHEIKRLWPSPFIEFADDNTFVNRAWSEEFLRMLATFGLRWFTETDVRVADHPGLPKLMYDAGCYQVLIGFESPSAESLAGIDRSNWKAKRRGEYLRAIDTLQSAGVTVNGCFIVGLDADTPGIFEQVNDFVRESGLIEVQVTVLTPFPGTRLYDRLKREGRLLQERFWDRCTLFDVNFTPKQMTVDELESGLRWLFRELYSEQATNRRKRHYVEVVKRLEPAREEPS